MAEDFHAEVVTRLRASEATRAQMALALAVLQQIRWYSVGPDLDVCRKTATEIADELGIKKNDMPGVLARLESVGAISRISDGREKVICLSPKYAETERNLGRYREIILPLFLPQGKYQFKVGITNIKGFWKQFKTDLADLLIKSPTRFQDDPSLQRVDLCGTGKITENGPDRERF